MKIGILGGGQLGRMMALAGLPLGHEFRFLDVSGSCPASAVGQVVVGQCSDKSTLDEFARGLDVATFEWENVPVEAVEWLGRKVPTAPSTVSLAASQDRIAEKEFFARNSIPVQAFARVGSVDELARACGTVGFPGVLKTRRMGYDGKGQAVLRTPTDAPAAWSAMNGAPCIYEAHAPFTREVSAIAARGRDGATVIYPLCENVHKHGILRTTIAPAPGLGEQVVRDIHRCMEAALDALGHVGVLTIEFFVTPQGVVANEMAPRVHNSGHWTQDGAITSQFENHVRAITGAPLGSAEARGHAGMVNLIGRAPELNDMLGVPGAHTHLYGKEPRKGRKLGHLNVCAATAQVRDAQMRVASAMAEATADG